MNQNVMQAVVVTGTTRDSNQTPIQLALFNADGVELDLTHSSPATSTLDGLEEGADEAIAEDDTVLEAFAKLQAQIDAIKDDLAG